MECGFKKENNECTEECKYFNTCTRNPHGKILKKDRECIQCKKFFEWKGKPQEVKRCINFVERRKKHELRMGVDT